MVDLDLDKNLSMKDDLAQVDYIETSQPLNLIKQADQNTAIVLDFDETLLLRNSTAEYINSLRPRWLGLVLIIFLRAIKPWNWLPKPWQGDKVRDWFLVITPTILLPWTFLLWRQKALTLARKHGNSELLAAVEQNSNSPIIIASLGFNFVIQPILQHLPINYSQLIGCRFWQGAGDRDQGKLAMMRSTLTEAEIKSAIVVTDSKDDLPLLQIVAHPCLVLWSDAKYVDPFSDFWLYTMLKRLKH